MKKLIVALVLLSALALPRPAAANLKEVRFNRLAFLTAYSQCSLVLTVLLIEQNMINGSETLTADGAPVANLGEFKASGGSLSVGKDILFASDGFTAATGLAADVKISDSACESLKPGVVLGYTSSFGTKSDIFTIPAGLGLNTAVDGDGKLTDLTAAAVTISNSKGESATIGTGTPTGGGNGGGDSGGGGCQLSPGRAASGSLLAVLALLGLSLVGRRRTRTTLGK